MLNCCLWRRLTVLKWSHEASQAVWNSSKGTSACLSPTLDKHGKRQPAARGCAACGRHGISWPCQLWAPLVMLLRVQLIVLAEVEMASLRAPRSSGRGAIDQLEQEALDYRERVERFYTIKNVGPRSSTAGCERKSYCIMFNCIASWPTVKWVAIQILYLHTDIKNFSVESI